MARILLLLIPTIVMVFSIIDIATIDSGRVRHLPKSIWVIIVIFLSIIGSILWWGIGRGPVEQRSHGRVPDPPASPRAKGPDDDPDFLRSLDRK